MDESIYLSLLAKANEVKTAKGYGIFFSNGFLPIILKGWSIARFYDDRIRTYTDIDLAFDPQEWDKLVSFIESVDFSSIAMDVHFGLRHLDLLSWGSIYERSYAVENHGLLVRVLADEDNLRVTSVHWLTDGGVNKEKLWDIFYLVKNRKADFDWDRCLGSNGPIRKTWVLAAIATARDHLSLDVSGLPIEAQDFQLPDWYKKTLEKEWERGPYIRRVMSTVITKPKLLFEQLQRRFPPNRIAASIDTETPIDNTSRIPAQVKSLTHKIRPFARGLGQRLTYKRQKHDR